VRSLVRGFQTYRTVVTMIIKYFAFLLSALLPLFSAAQSDYPSRPIRLVVPFTAGGPTDNVARVLADDLSKRLGQQMIVENRPGATGFIGQDFVNKAPGDGYTLVMITSLSSNNYPNLKKELDFRKDFAMVGRVYTTANLIAVNPRFPGMENITSLKQLIATIKANPGKFNYTSAGAGGPAHVSMEMMKLHHGLKIEYVGYKGASQALQDVLAGHIPVFMASPNNMPQFRSGQLRPLAVGTEGPSPLFPGLPTFADEVPGLTALSWIGLAASPGTPKPIVDRLMQELQRSLTNPEMRARVVTAVGVEPDYLDAASFTASATRNYQEWVVLLRETGVKVAE